MHGNLILGIDPGSRKTGWGIVGEEAGSLRCIACGVVRPPLVADQQKDFSQRLAYIFNELSAIIASHQLANVAIESVFTAKNAQSALKLGQARGAAVAACAAAKLPVSDYEPTLIKQSVTGSGRATKEQVAFMVGRLLNIKTDRLLADATDALAVAICHIACARLKKLTEI